MSLLQQDALDDAALGEELTKGSSHVVWATIAAIVVVSIAIGSYIYFERAPVVSTGEVIAVWVHPQHTETSGLDANGAPMAKEIVDQVMVFTQVKLENHTSHPLYLMNVLTNATFADGIHSSYAANEGDYQRIFVAYPDIPVPHNAALSPLDTTIGPGQTVEGTFVSAFKMTKQDWDAHTKLDYTFDFRYQPSLTLTPQVPITEQ
ncbi:MAG TPA: hypothetical protein VMT38_08685 [Terracidiphilus sp.]|nr:hypothetical protein [Terracidiphilus sp.]